MTVQETEREDGSKRHFLPLLAGVTSLLCLNMLGIGVEGMRCLRPGATEWAVGTARFELSHLGAPPAASLPQPEGGGQAGRQRVLPVLPSPASQTCQFLFCWRDDQGNHMQKGSLRKTSLLRARRASSQDTS